MPRLSGSRTDATGRAGGRAGAPAPVSRHLPDRPGRGRIAWRRARRLLPNVAAMVAVLAVLLAAGSALRGQRVEGFFGGARDLLAGWLDLRVRHVLVEGQANTPERLLRAALGVSPGDSLLGFSVADARARVQTLSWVQNAAVERRLPDTIVVHLSERAPFAIWQNQRKFTLIDRHGNPVTDQDVSAFANLPLVVGPDAPAHAAEMLELLGQFPAVLSHIAAIARIGERRWNLQLNNTTVVMLPEAHEREALARLAELQASQSLLDRPLAVVDLRLPDKMVIRQRNEPAKDATTPSRKST